jgi:hypothetical protein
MIDEIDERLRAERLRTTAAIVSLTDRRRRISIPDGPSCGDARFVEDTPLEAAINKTGRYGPR